MKHRVLCGSDGNMFLNSKNVFIYCSYCTTLPSVLCLSSALVLNFFLVNTEQLVIFFLIGP